MGKELSFVLLHQELVTMLAQIARLFSSVSRGMIRTGLLGEDRGKKRFLLSLIMLAFVLVSRHVCPAHSSAETWLISSRRAPTRISGDESISKLQLWKLEKKSWATSSCEAFLEGLTPEIPTIFYFHGNMASSSDAVRQGSFLRKLIEAKEKDGYRLVIWSWPASRIRGRLRNDVRVKAARSDTQGYYLAQLLTSFPEKSRIGFVGFSFGARTVCSSLALLSGEKIANAQLSLDASQRKRVGSYSMRSVLLAPAFDQYWLKKDRRYGRVTAALEKMVVIYNPSDIAMHFYPLMYYAGGPEALGFLGPPRCDLTEEAEQTIEGINVMRSVGKVHNAYRYLGTSGFRRQISSQLLFVNEEGG
jgi:hypothetical protein